MLIIILSGYPVDLSVLFPPIVCRSSNIYQDEDMQGDRSLFDDAGLSAPLRIFAVLFCRLFHLHAREAICLAPALYQHLPVAQYLAGGDILWLNLYIRLGGYILHIPHKACIVAAATAAIIIQIDTAAGDA